MEIRKEADLSNRLCLIIPKEKHQKIANIVNEIIGNEDEFDVDDMLVSEYESVCEENFRLAEKLREMPTDLVAENTRLKEEIQKLKDQIEAKDLKNQILEEESVSRISQIEQCRKDKDIITGQLSKERQEMSDTLTTILTYLKDEIPKEDYNNVIDKLTDEQIARYNLEEFQKEHKYKIVTVEVSRTTRKLIKVILHDDDNDNKASDVIADSEYENNLNDCIDENLDDYNDTDYNYTIDQVECDLSLRDVQVLDQGNLWYGDEIGTEVYGD